MADSFDETSHSLNAGAKETHVTDERRTTPLSSEDHFNDIHTPMSLTQSAVTASLSRDKVLPPPQKRRKHRSEC